MERIDIILEYIYKTNLVVNRMMQLDVCMLQEVVIKLNVTIGVLVHYVNHWDH